MITVFGSINLDLVVAVPRLPLAGETVSGPDHQFFAGGKGANQALAARRAGAEVAMIGAVGADAFADLAMAGMRDDAVDLSGVRTSDGATGLALIGVDAKGENQIIVASGANARVDAGWLEGCLKPGSVLMVQGEVPAKETLAAMKIAKASDTKVFWNPAPVPSSDLARLLENIDFLIVNETEAAEIADALGVPPEVDAFLDAFSDRQCSVVVTLGAKGIKAVQGSYRYQFSAPQIDAVDTTGAGDAFCGALAAAVDRKIPFERALKEGVAAGSLACTVTGAQSSAPRLADIQTLADQIA